MKKLLTILSLVGLFNFPGFSQNLNTKKLDSLFDALQNNNQIMGSFAIAKNGKTIYTRSIGYSTINTSEKIRTTGETLYRIGSVTKTFTATMIFQLIEEGKISLTTPLDHYFPQIPNSNKITIEILLKHRSGLFDFVNDQEDTAWIKKPQTANIIIGQIVNGKPKFSPDKKVTYSNSGFYLLARIIENVTGLTYNENLQKRICSKLQMRNTYSPPNNELKNNEANSYTLADGQWVKVNDNYFPNIVGVGDILSTTADLILFIDALLDSKLTSQKSLGLMGGFGCKNCRGMGIMKIPFNKKSGLGHRGDTFGTHTAVIKFTDDSLTFTSCINGTVSKPSEITNRVLSICFDEKYEIPSFNSKEE